MIIPTEDIIQQQRQNFEQICERIKHLDIRQNQTNVDDFNQFYPTIRPIDKSISTQQISLPSINELIDYQLLIKRIKELEMSIILQNQEIANLRKENSELNEKCSLLIHVGVNAQLESKIDYLKREFDDYKEELNEKFSKYTNDMKVVNDFFDLNNNIINQNDIMTFDGISTTFESNPQSMNFQSYVPPQENNDSIMLQRNNLNNNNDDNNNFDNIRKELRNVANELDNDRDSLAERMNSLRNMYYNHYY
ncbi:hypothetical protein C1645_846168 [Glomus cerebriforme]|uniref:Uncharacterized protein n=1 Tax=Glomus cerebriforme TaxID=658196 RepID=A0A397T1H7_9GLOM|nr:hypothetical protein C1645_846168 [Glomus cerebriforme]